MSDCDLCDINADYGYLMSQDNPYLILCICKTCKIPMVIAGGHRPNFTTKEREVIMEAFLGKKIRWEMRSLKDHAHCHIEG